MKKNDIIELLITAVASEGNGVGRFNGIAVFVPMTAAGDKIEAKIVKTLKSHAFAIIHRIIEPSPHRIENDCPYYRRCGGCSLRHIDYENEIEIKTGWVRENLRRIGGVEISLDESLPSPENCFYRNKAQYPVRLVDGELRAGFFAKRSHELVPVESCLLQPAFFRDIVDEVISFCKQHSVVPYDETKHSGLLRHIFIRYAEATGEAMLCLIVNAAHLPHADELVERMDKRCPAVKTIVVNENRTKSNVIFGDKTHVVSGTGAITDMLCGVRVNISAQSFYQVNRRAAERLYRAALEYAEPDKDDILLDLYCGAGTIGLSMAHAVSKVIGVEVVEAAVSDANENARRNGITNASFICADAAEAADTLKSRGIRPNIIVVDPPRKGLDEKLPALIQGLLPDKLVYISCNPATLARDIARLVPLGFELQKARAVDLFPRTAHVECVALMSRG